MGLERCCLTAVSLPSSFWLQFLPGWLQEFLLERFFGDKKHSPKNTQLPLEVVRTILSVEHVETHPEKQQPAA